MHQLQFKPLINIWDRSIYSSKKSHAYDAQFAINALFSVEAFSTNPKNPNPIFCREALEIFLQEIRNVRENIQTNHSQKKKEWGDINLVPFVANKHSLEMKIAERRLCRSTGLLLKTFSSANDYLLDLHRAQHNEEISDSDFMECRTKLINLMNNLIYSIANKNQVFHVERKKLEAHQ